MSCCRENIMYDGGSSTPSIFSAIYLDTPIHVKGDTSKPYLYIIVTPPAGISFSFSYWIADINGTILSDVKSDSFPPGTRVGRYLIGDWIESQRTTKNIPPGMYLLIVHEMYGGAKALIPIYLVTNRITIPREDYLEQIIVYDVTTGAMMTYPPTLGYAPADDRYIIFKYYHDGRRGRLVKLKNDGSVEWDTGWARYAIIKNTIKFTSAKGLLYYLFSRAVGFPHELVSHTIGRIELGYYNEAVKILKPYYRATMSLFGRLQVEVDLEKNEIRETIGMYMGFLETIQKVIMGAVLSCIGGAVIGGAIGSIVPGIGTIVGAKAGCLVSAGGYILYNVFTTMKSGDTKTQEEVRKELENIANKGINDMNNERTELDNYLQEQVNRGVIPREVYEKVMQHVNKMYDIAVSTMKKIVEEGEKAYEEGYKKGVAESKMWIAIAGLGGGLLGFMLGRR